MVCRESPNQNSFNKRSASAVNRSGCCVSIVTLSQQASQPAVAWDDRQTRLSWRGDGEYFACSTVDPSSQSRVIRVWSRECVLHSTSETINGLEHTLAWK